MTAKFTRGQRVVDVDDGRTGVITEKATLGQIFAGHPSYPDAWDVLYDDGTERRRMDYHLQSEPSEVES